MKLTPELTARNGHHNGYSNIEVVEIEEVYDDVEKSDAVIENERIYDEHFELAYTKSAIENVLGGIDKYYFRAKFVGFDEFPERMNPKRPLIFVSNHSGMAFPWDAIVFCSALFKQDGMDLEHAVRPLIAPALSRSRLLNLFLIPDFWKRVGGIDATYLNFETMMHNEQSNLLLYPEGTPGIAKGFDNRYKMQRFSTSFIRMSMKYKSDIIPFATVNAEFINPFSYSLERINEIVQDYGIPFLPIGPMLFWLPAQPWMFYFALPAKLTYVMGRRIQPWKMIDKPYEEITRREFMDIRDRVQMQMQEELDRSVAKYGRRPYRIFEFLKVTLTNLTKFRFYNPVIWPLLFAEHERRYNAWRRKVSIKEEVETAEVAVKMSPENENIGEQVVSLVNMVAKNPQILAFYIPVIGWIPMLMGGNTDE